MQGKMGAIMALALTCLGFSFASHATDSLSARPIDMGAPGANTMTRNFPMPKEALCFGGGCMTGNAPATRVSPANAAPQDRLPHTCNVYSFSHATPYDIDGDCISDLLWMNDQTHQFGWWLVGTSYSSSGASFINRTLGNVINITPGYRIAATGDFNGDYKADLIWTSDNRDLYLWTSTGSGFSAQYITTYPAGWRLVGAADIDGDGKDDLIWENDGACEYGYWLMDGNTIKSLKTISVTCGFQIAFIDTAFDSPNKTTPAIYWVNVSNSNYTLTSLYRWLPQSDTLNAVFLGYAGGGTIVGAQTTLSQGSVLILDQSGVLGTCQDIPSQCYPNTAGMAVPGSALGQYAIVAAGHYLNPNSQDLLWASSDGSLVVANYTLTGNLTGSAPPYRLYTMPSAPSGWHIVRPGTQN